MAVALWGLLCVVCALCGHWVIGALGLLLLVVCAPHRPRNRRGLRVRSARRDRAAAQVASASKGEG